MHHPASGARPAAAPDDRLFGPYLGGRQVRLAVSGLGRVFPLHYAGGSAAGTEQDLARARGVDPADRARLAAAVTAVLDRDQAAVTALRGSLAERRDAAAAVLAFERAGRVQQEIEALDWVTARQRVTRPGQPDGAACGWFDGTLVRFEIQAGRRAGWPSAQLKRGGGKRVRSAA